MGVLLPCEFFGICYTEKKNRKAHDRDRKMEILSMKNSSCVWTGIRTVVLAAAFTFLPGGMGTCGWAENVRGKEPNLDLSPLIQKAEAGDAESQAALGIFYVAGREVPRNVPEGIRWLEKAANQNDARAVYYWGLCFLDGIGMKPDWIKGRNQLAKAMDLGYVPAKMFMGKCLLEERYGLRKDLSKAKGLLEEAANDENPEAQYLLGMLYSGKEKEIAPSRRRMMKWLTLSASHGFVPAQIQLGKEYLRSKNYFWAREWLEEADKANSAEAAFLIGIQELEGWGSGTPDAAEAEKMLQKAAFGGIPDAQLFLGAMKKEMGVEFDAAFWIQSAALKGSKEAKDELKKMKFSPDTCLKMGTVLFLGLDGLKDFREAEIWLKKAEEQNVAAAACPLAKMSLYGIGGEVNISRAIKLMEKGVEKEDWELISELAWCSYAGLGVPRNFAKVLELVRKSESTGNQNLQIRTLFALCAFFGQGMEMDRDLALKNFRQACVKNEPFAEAWIGFTTTHPLPNDADQTSAWQIIQKAAEQGNAWAQCLMGISFEKGIGVPRDLAESNRWLHLAASQGCPTAEFLMFIHADFGIGMDLNPSQAMERLNAAKAKGYSPAIEWDEIKKRSFLESTVKD